MKRTLTIPLWLIAATSLLGLLLFRIHLGQVVERSDTLTDESIKASVISYLEESISKLSEEKKVDSFIYLSDSLVYWNTNRFTPSMVVDRPAVLFNGQDGYICYPVKTKNKTLIKAKTVIKDRVLTHPPRLLRNLKIHVKPKQGIGMIQRDGQWVGDITTVRKGLTHSRFTNLWFIGLFILLITGFLWAYATRRYFVALITLFGFFILRFFIQHPTWSFFITDISYFQPDILASNRLPSLGHLLVDTLCLSFLLVWVNPWIDALKDRFPNSVLFGYSVLVFFGFDLFLGLVRTVVLDSTIVYNLSEGHGASASLFIVLGVLFIAGYLIHYLLSAVVNSLRERPNLLSYGIVLTGFAVFFLFQFIDADRTFRGLLPVLLLTALFITGPLLFEGRKLGRWWMPICLVVLGTGLILHYNQEHEKEYLELFASKLINNKDLAAENQFKEFENQLAQEFLVPRDFETFRDEKDLFESRLRRLYFSGYLTKYDLKVVSFDSLGNNINANPLFRQSDLDEIYNYLSYPTLSYFFYQVKQPAPVNGYIAKYENCDLQGNNGEIYLLVQPRIIQSEHYYPFIEKEGRNVFNMEDYSYGIYQDGVLTSQKGEFPYPLKIPEGGLKQSDNPFIRYTHFIGDQQSQTVIISKQFNGYTQVASLLMMVVLISLAGVLLIHGYQKWAGLDHPNNLFRLIRPKDLLSRRIQTAMFLLLFGGLLASVYVSIQLIRFNYQDRQESVIKETLKNMVVQLQNQVDLKQKLDSSEERQLIVNELSDIYQVDLNIYQPDGSLLVSSKPSIFEKSLLSEYLNPEAFQGIVRGSSGLMVLQEKILDQRYASAYMPLIGSNRQLLGVVNLPYFTNEKILNEEISTLVVNYVSIYLLLLIVGFLATYFLSRRITSPLQKISEGIERINLIERNEPIAYQGNDEIGQLVSKYNFMVEQLQQSAEQLAESEREGAWREMAKQVAHEIKNPLTPMKLSIQHLQRAWDNQHPKMDELFEKTSRLLIEQINNLSALATEFSSFAKMPRNNFETINLKEVVEQAISLFRNSSQFQIEAHLHDVHVEADRNQMSRLFTNLIKNSEQALDGKENGQVVIQMKTESERVIITIEDNGPGVPDNMKEKIFQPNFSTKTSGMGLGLAISRKIIETSDGSIVCEDSQLGGAQFIVELPVVKPSNSIQ